MKRRLFLGFSVPPDIGKRINRKIEAFQALPILWVPIENQHITVFFLGWVDDERLPDIVTTLSSVCQEMEAFDVVIEKIILSPDAIPDRIEAVGEESEELRNFYNRITQALCASSVDRRSFRPHITLGRIRRNAWKQLSQQVVIDIPVRFSLPVVEISIFESVILNGKRRYVSIEDRALGT